MVRWLVVIRSQLIKAFQLWFRQHPAIKGNIMPRNGLPVNSLAPGKFERKLRHIIFKQISVIDGWGISCEIALIWMSLDFIDDQSTMVQVMAWCRQAASHYLSQCWPRSLSPYGVTRPQWVLSKKLIELRYGRFLPALTVKHSMWFFY